MVYVVTLIWILLIFMVEYHIQKHDSTSVFSFLKSVSLYKTVEQMLVIVLSATIAIMFSGYSEKAKTKKRYSALLESVVAQVNMEEQYLGATLNITHEAEAEDEETVQSYDYLLRGYDMTAMLDNVIGTNEAAMTFGPYLYGNILREANNRKVVLEAIYSKNYSVCGDRLGCIVELDDTDNRLLYLLNAQKLYLEDGGDEKQIISEFMDAFYSEDAEEGE